MTTEDVKLDGRFVTVVFDFTKGCPQTEWDPGADDEYEIVSVEGIKVGRFTENTLKDVEKALRAAKEEA